MKLMKSRQNCLSGTAEVYRFTFGQMVKGKANILTLIIMAVAVLASGPLMALFSEEKKPEKSEITAVYVNNTSGYPLAYEGAAEEYFADTRFVDCEWTKETFREEIGSTEVFAQITRDVKQGEISLDVFTTEGSEIEQNDLDACTNVLSGLFNAARYSRIDAEEEQLALLMSGYTTDVQKIAEYAEPESISVDDRLAVQLAYSIVVLILCTFTTSYIVQKVVEEKSSKLTEMLMVSIKPLALLAGKILAVMTYICGLVVLLGGMFLVSSVLTEQYTGVDTAAKLLASMQMGSSSLRLSAGMIVVFAVSLALGYLTVSFLSGLLGAACSSMEDVEPVNMIVVMIVMAGYLTAIITTPLKMGAGASAAVSLIPILSIFCAPVYFMLGDIGLGILLLSWVIQILLLMLLWHGCAKIYRDLMLYRGSRMKIGRILLMMGGNGRKGGNR